MPTIVPEVHEDAVRLMLIGVLVALADAKVHHLAGALGGVCAAGVVPKIRLDKIEAPVRPVHVGGQVGPEGFPIGIEEGDLHGEVESIILHVQRFCVLRLIRDRGLVVVAGTGHHQHPGLNVIEDRGQLHLLLQRLLGLLQGGDGMGVSGGLSFRCS